MSLAQSWPVAWLAHPASFGADDSLSVSLSTTFRYAEISLPLISSELGKDCSWDLMNVLRASEINKHVVREAG